MEEKFEKSNLRKLLDTFSITFFSSYLLSPRLEKCYCLSKIMKLGKYQGKREKLEKNK